MSSCQFQANSAEEATADIKCSSSGEWVKELGGVVWYHTFIIEAHNKHDSVPEKFPTRLWFNLVFSCLLFFLQLPGRVAPLIFAFECVTFAFTALLPALCHEAPPHPPPLLTLSTLLFLLLLFLSCRLFSNFKTTQNKSKKVKMVELHFLSECFNALFLSFLRLLDFCTAVPRKKKNTTNCSSSS